MITYVYDGNTQKLTFTSDENNYFTKYNYDASDNLESINKETAKGVQTIKEARSATVKHP
jgi:YD repeat-containing protein